MEIPVTSSNSESLDDREDDKLETGAAGCVGSLGLSDLLLELLLTSERSVTGSGTGAGAVSSFTLTVAVFFFFLGGTEGLCDLDVLVSLFGSFKEWLAGGLGKGDIDLSAGILADTLLLSFAGLWWSMYIICVTVTLNSRTD